MILRRKRFASSVFFVYTQPTYLPLNNNAYKLVGWSANLPASNHAMVGWARSQPSCLYYYILYIEGTEAGRLAGNTGRKVGAKLPNTPANIPTFVSCTDLGANLPASMLCMMQRQVGWLQILKYYTNHPFLCKLHKPHFIFLVLKNTCPSNCTKNLVGLLK